MAMFEFKDSEDISLERCKTSSESLLKAERTSGVRATDCEAGSSVSGQPPQLSLFKRAIHFLMKHIGAIVVATVAAVVSGVILVSLGFGPEG